MELGWLKDFEALEAHRNFSRAAEERHASQPALSRRIRALEQAVGARLIDRETLPLSLTPAGEVFLAQARTMLRTWTDTVDRCQTIEAANNDVIRFATTHSLYTSLYQDRIAPLAETYQISTDLTSTSWAADQFVSALQQRYSDAVLIYWHPSMEFLTPLAQSNFDFITLSHDRLELLSAPGPTGALFDPDHASAPLPLLSYSSASALRPVQDNALSVQLAGVDTFVVNQNAQSMSVKAMIVSGFGLGWLPHSLCAGDIASGALIPQRSERAADIEVRLYIDRTNPKPALKKFWQALC